MSDQQDRQIAEQIVQFKLCPNMSCYIGRPCGTCVAQRDMIASALTQARAEGREEGKTLLRDSYVILEGLRRGVEWELAPPIMAEIARVAGALRPICGRPRGDEDA